MLNDIRNIPTKLLKSAYLVVFFISALSELLVHLVKHNCAKWLRPACLIVFFTIILSSLPVHFRRDGASAQRSSSKRQLPPYYKLPDLNGLITEGKKSQRADLPLPPLKPATICGYRDEACKQKKAKEKKVGQNFTPPNGNALQNFDDLARKSDRDWLGRFGSAFSKVLPGITSVSAEGNPFLWV